MGDQAALSRRRLLWLSGLVAGGAVLAACAPDEGDRQNGTAGEEASGQGSETEPLPAPEQFSEAPSLTELVEAGELPPVEERLPERPYVTPHRWQQAGSYGGDWHLAVYGTGDAAIGQYMYGHSILRHLNDGMDVGPGLAESWESNEDFTQWTFHFREGLKWSDGTPWSTTDVLYWWEDTVLDSSHPEVAPDEAVSGEGTVADITAPDSHTLVITFDAAAPLMPARLADTVNRSVGAHWMLPSHYLQQFHPKYSPDVTADDWYVNHDEKANFLTNPDCPVMTGWRLATYNEGRNATWERNPYYWCVDRDGNQLPFINRMIWNAVEDEEVMQLWFTEGRVDFANGQHASIDLGDVQGLEEAQARSDLLVWDWGSGSGSGSMFFFNYDYPDDAMRELIRNPTFRQALSHAYNREDVRKSLYYDTGELTTGTLSPKAPEFHYNEDGAEVYRAWRDSYVEYDPELAKELLDSIGVVDSDGDGYREKPDGSKLVVRLDYPADTARENIQKNDLLQRDWEAVGIRAEQNPVSPTAWGDTWSRGELMSHTAWEIGGGGIMSWPSWVIPTIPDTWAPLHGQAFILRSGDPEKLEAEQDVNPWERQPPWVLPDEGSPIERLWDLYARARMEQDELTRYELLWQMCQVHIEEGPFFLGVVADYPQIILVRRGLRNVPQRDNLHLGGQINTWDIPVPAIYDPEAWFWENPDEHS